MLKDGKFIKQDLPKIGVYYIPPKRNFMTDDDVFMQSTLLPQKEKKKYEWAELFVATVFISYVLFGIYAWLE